MELDDHMQRKTHALIAVHTTWQMYCNSQTETNQKHTEDGGFSTESTVCIHT